MCISDRYKLPLSASVIDEEVIKNRDAQHIEDILFAIPNINYSTGSSRGKFLQIRGIGERSEFTEPVNYSVGVIIDGIDFTGISLAASTFDIEQIEVLKGPQGTIYGANALAGLVNIVSKKPADAFHSEILGSFSEFNGRSLGFVFTGPLNENSGFRLGVKKYESDGFIKNQHLQTDQPNNIDEFVSRFKFYMNSNDQLLEVNLIYSDVDNGYDAFSLDNTRITLSDEPGHDVAQRSDASRVGKSKEDSGTDSDTASSIGLNDYDESIYVDHLGHKIIGEAAQAQLLFHRYETAKAQWRRHMNKPNRRTRKHFRAKCPNMSGLPHVDRLTGSGISRFVQEMTNEQYLSLIHI